MKWTAEMLELTPQFCTKCETRVRKILPSRYIVADMVVVRCGHCGYILAKLRAEEVERSLGVRYE